MIPISDENPTLRAPVVTLLILAALVFIWVFVQGMGAPAPLMASVCNLGLVAGEITGRAAVGTGIALGQGWACLVDREPINVLTPLTSMFLHGGWMHLIGNGLFLWVFGNNVEDSMGRVRFLAFYVLGGLAAILGQFLVGADEPVPLIGASGAVAGVLGGYLLLYPRARVVTLVFIVLFFTILELPALFFLGFWFLQQVAFGYFDLAGPASDSGGVAYFAHIGGFVFGALLIRAFARRRRPTAAGGPGRPLY